MSLAIQDSDPAAEFATAQRKRDDRLIHRAIAVLERRLFSSPRQSLATMRDLHDYVRLQLAEHVDEHFGILLLDTHLCPIAFEIVAKGTVDGACVYLRDIARRVLFHNAAALAVVHNHPTGRTEPSVQDRTFTRNAQEFLSLMNVRLIDHLIVGRGAPFSFSDRGLL